MFRLCLYERYLGEKVWNCCVRNKCMGLNGKNTPLKDTNWKGKFKRGLSFFLLDKESFWLWNCLSRNSTMFSSRRSAKFHSRQRSFGRLFRYLFYSMVKKITFLKGNLCMYKSQTFLTNFVFDYKRKITKCTPIWDGFCVQFCHVLIRFQEITSLSVVLVCSFITLAQNTTARLQHYFCEDIGEFYRIFTFRFSFWALFDMKLKHFVMLKTSRFHRPQFGPF